MKFFSSFTYLLVALLSCTNKTDIKNEILNFHACISKCEELPTDISYNFIICTQECTDLFDRKKNVCNSLDSKEREKCIEDISVSRDQCIETCQQRMITTRSEIQAQIKKCQDICIYNLKNK